MFSLWVYAGVSSKSWLDSRWDLCPAKPCGGMLILYTSEYHPRLGWIHRGALVAVSSVRWDAHLYYAGFHTSHGCIRSAGTCRVNRTVICCAVFHKSHGWALAVQNVLTKSARRDARILSPQTQQHTVHDTQSRIEHCELFRANGVHDTQSRIGHCGCFAQMVCTTPNRELGVASRFAQMACTTLNRELGIASCFAQMSKVSGKHFYRVDWAPRLGWVRGRAN